MDYFDFISLPPSIYLMNKKKAKSKLGGFFSILLVLTMIGITIYYLFDYFKGNRYNIRYYSDNLFSLSDEEKLSIQNNLVEMFLFINLNYDNCKIHLLYGNQGKYDDETTIPKCNDQFNVDTKKLNCYHLNFSLYSSKNLILASEGECVDSDGEPYLIDNLFQYKLLSINHKNDNPLNDSISIKNQFLIPLTKNSEIHNIIQFTPVIYKTTKKFRIFNNKKDTYIGKFMSNQKYITINKNQN